MNEAQQKAYDALRDFDRQTNDVAVERHHARIELAKAFHAAKEPEEKPPAPAPTAITPTPELNNANHLQI